MSPVLSVVSIVIISKVIMSKVIISKVVMSKFIIIITIVSFGLSKGELCSILAQKSFIRLRPDQGRVRLFFPMLASLKKNQSK